VASAVQLHGPTANLANTRALVVEPMLNALGWDPTNLEQVARDWPLSGNYSISYALRVSDRNALFVQTTPIDVGVDDSALVDETLDHVAMSGSETGWCLITNGLHYRVFKADDAVARDNRLLFELELADVASDPSSDAANDLALLSREALMNGSLELRGEEFYVDPRVRQALLDLCRNPSPSFLDAMNEAVGGPSVPVERVRASLSRAVDRGRRQSGPNGALMTESPSFTRPRGRQTAAAATGADSTESSSEPHPGRPSGFGPLKSPPEPAAAESGDGSETGATAGDVSAAAVGTAVAERPQQLPTGSVADLETEEEHAGVAAPEEQAAAVEALPEAKLLEDTTAEGSTSVVAEPEPAELEAADPEPAPSELTEPEASHPEVAQAKPAESEPHWNEPRHSRFGAGRGEHALVDHLTGKPAMLVEIFEDLDHYARSLGEDTARRVRKRSIDYSRSRRSWFSLEIHHEGIRMMVALEPAAIEHWVALQPQREPIAVGPGLFGESEYTMTERAQLDDGHDLLRLAYETLG
jgi:hypothetical protein